MPREQSEQKLSAEMRYSNLLLYQTQLYLLKTLPSGLEYQRLHKERRRQVGLPGK
jgi:hypothetical protein